METETPIENAESTKAKFPLVLRILPLITLIFLFGIDVFLIQFLSEHGGQKIEFGNFGFDSELGTIFSVFIALALADFYVVNMLVEKALKDSKNTLVALMIPTTIGIFGFVLAYLSLNLTFFYPFLMLSFLYYIYAYRKLFS